MAEDLVASVRAVPAEAFREPPRAFEELSPLERLRWLQETARFVWKHRGAAHRGVEPERSGAL